MTKPAKNETQRVEQGRIDETLAPLRNFTISTADRVRAAAGPPAFSRRKRHIEDLEAALSRFVRQAVSEALGESGKRGERGEMASLGAEAAFRAAESDPRVVKCLRELNRLVVAHNRYYPIEANLPLDPATRLQLDHGTPWRPLQAITLEGVIAACGLAGHVGKMK